MIDFKKIALTFAIAVLLIIFVVLLADLIFPENRYEQYCDQEPYLPKVENLSETTARELDEKNRECNELFNTYQEKRNRNTFILMAILGFVALIFGIFIKIESLSAGLIFGGAIVIIIGATRIFGDLGRLSRTLLVGVGFAVLVYFTYKLSNNKKAKNKSRKR